MKHTGRKHRALERIRAIRNIAEQHARKRLERQARRQVVSGKIASVKDSIPNVREEIGFVVPKKDFRLNGNWPAIPGETLGFCACGCGGRTKRTKNANNYMKAGQFFRFISGHQWLLRRRLFKPKGWRSSYEIQNELYRTRCELAKTVATTKVQTFTELRQHYNPTVFGRPICNQGISRMLTVALGDNKPKLITIRRPITVAPITLNYPFISGQPTNDHDLLLAILEIIGHRVNVHVRGDLAQDIALAILQGKETLETVRSNIQRFINSWWRRFGFFGHNIVSLDAPMGREADAGSLYDLVDSQKAMTELHGGVNWDTRESSFEHISEDWDGKICARY